MQAMKAATEASSGYVVAAAAAAADKPKWKGPSPSHLPIADVVS